MKGDSEGKMNAVEKQCVVHVSSRPAIVGSSQSVTLLSRNFLFDFKNLPQFIHMSPARDIVKRFFIGGTPLVCRPYQRCRNWHSRPTFARDSWRPPRSTHLNQRAITLPDSDSTLSSEYKRNGGATPSARERLECAASRRNLRIRTWSRCAALHPRGDGIVRPLIELLMDT